MSKASDWWDSMEKKKTSATSTTKPRRYRGLDLNTEGWVFFDSLDTAVQWRNGDPYTRRIHWVLDRPTET